MAIELKRLASASRYGKSDDPIVGQLAEEWTELAGEPVAVQLIHPEFYGVGSEEAVNKLKAHYLTGHKSSAGDGKLVFCWSPQKEQNRLDLKLEIMFRKDVETALSKIEAKGKTIAPYLEMINLLAEIHDEKGFAGYGRRLENAFAKILEAAAG